METVTVSQAPAVSKVPAVASPAAGGATMATLPSAVQDLARFFLSLSDLHPLERLVVLRAWLHQHRESGFSCALRLLVVVQSHLVLRLPFLLVWVVLLLLLLLCPARPVISSVRRPPAPAGVAVARPVMGPGVRLRSVLGVGLLPLILLPATRRGPIGHPRSLPRIPEPRPVLPELDVRMEVLLVILAPLRRVAALLVLDLRVGRHGRPQERSGFTQVAVVDPPILREWRMMTVLVPSSRWTSIGRTLSDLSWPSSGTLITWKSRQEYHQLGARLLLHRSMV